MVVAASGIGGSGRERRRGDGEPEETEEGRRRTRSEGCAEQYARVEGYGGGQRRSLSKTAAVFSTL
eukprot:2668069-Rhodomonas_salina.1